MQSRSSSVDGTDRVHGKKTMGNGKDRTKGEVGLSTYLETFRSFKIISYLLCWLCGWSQLNTRYPQGLKNYLKITVGFNWGVCKLFYTFLSIQKIHQNRSHAFDTFHDRWQQTTDATTLTHHQPCWMSYTFFSSSLLLFEQPARLQR